MKKEPEFYSAKDTKNRLKAIMQGAKHKPTPLKALPRRNGQPRIAAVSKPAKRV